MRPVPSLCAAAVRLDTAARVRFAPLQSPSAQQYLQTQGLPTQDFDSLVFVPDWAVSGAPLLRTDGVLSALRKCNRVGRTLAAILSLIPVGWRDRGYKLVARWRYRIWGEWHPRPLARPEWAARFFQ